MTTKTDTIYMHVDGSFLTDLVRTWFWDEHRPISTCVDLIRTCCAGYTESEIYAFTTEILEGRKRFDGIDTFHLVDDNQNIRPLLFAMEQQERNLLLSQIQTDMEHDFRKYVDRWSTLKSTHKDALDLYHPITLEEHRQYYTQTQESSLHEWEDLMIGDLPLIETPTMGGLWLSQRPELVLTACRSELQRIGTTSFWENIYEAVKDDPIFTDRNTRYRFSTRPKPPVPEPKLPDVKDIPPEGSPYLSPAWFDEQYAITKDLIYRMVPDDLTNWEGLIAPNGDFYSCSFGSHNLKAYYLIKRYPERFPEFSNFPMERALDILRDRGWCATRSVWTQHVMYPNLPVQPTKHQIHTLLNLCEKHRVTNPDLLSDVYQKMNE